MSKSIFQSQNCIGENRETTERISSKTKTSSHNSFTKYVRFESVTSSSPSSSFQSFKQRQQKSQQHPLVYKFLALAKFIRTSNEKFLFSLSLSPPPIHIFFVLVVVVGFFLCNQFFFSFLLVSLNTLQCIIYHECIHNVYLYSHLLACFFFLE